MKKMFFTAIALVAFSATSMANTIEVKEVEILEGEKEVLILRNPTCVLIMTYMYEYYVDYEGAEESVDFLNLLTSQCDK